MLTNELIKQKRSPKELRRFAAEVVAHSKLNSDEQARAFLMEGPYKQFRDEIIPLAMCVERLYAEDHRIEPVPGNQGYDVRVFNASGDLVDHIEIAHPHDGRARAIHERLAVTDGYSVQSVEHENLPALRQKLIETCRAKAQNDYSRSTLIIVIDWDELSWLEEEQGQQEAFFNEVAAEIAGYTFKARRVFLYEGIADRLACILE